MRTHRARHSIPSDILEALSKHAVRDAYASRPPYQRNDYIGWIVRAKREETRARRLTQMLDELKRGDVYMKMRYSKRK
jgi:uncharacterized protein YdeI (YjbR/CyaY-like superfamily)